jgi:uncharacterized membrane protein
MMNKFLTRIRNPKVITAIVSGILIILVNTGVIDVDMSAKVQHIVDTVLGVGVTIGVFGDPTSHLNKNN